MSLDKVSKFSIVSAYAVVYFVWGSTYFFIEKALHWFPPFVLGSIRFIIAGSVLMTYCYLKGYKLFNKRDVERAVLIGFLLLFVDMAAVIWAEQYISSAIVSILGAAAAIWFVLLDKPKWKANFGSIPIVFSPSIQERTIPVINTSISFSLFGIFIFCDRNACCSGWKLFPTKHDYCSYFTGGRLRDILIYGIRIFPCFTSTTL